jgi:hypothetical protein
MKRDQLNVPPGGGKKFLYSGPQRRGSVFDEAGQTGSSGWQGQQSNKQQPQTGEAFLNDVWSIKKNVNIGKGNELKPNQNEGWNLNMGKGFYSRHGVLSDNGSPRAPQDNNGQLWNSQKSYSYSHGASNNGLSPRQAPGDSTGTREFPGGGRYSKKF